MSSDSSPDSVVTPGTPLGSIEEYSDGEGAYSGPDGVVRAVVVGRPRWDRVAHVASVAPARRPLIPGYKSDVVALVTSVRRDMVVVEIIGEASAEPKFRWVREYPGTYTGGIPISQIADEFIEDTSDYYRIGDIILARVISRGPPYTLTTKQPQYGVLIAQCSRCGSLLEPLSDRTMKCPRCGHIEKRKVSIHASTRIAIRLKRLLIKTFT